jgi:hypothetical protein
MGLCEVLFHMPSNYIEITIPNGLSHEVFDTAKCQPGTYLRVHRARPAERPGSSSTDRFY